MRTGEPPEGGRRGWRDCVPEWMDRSRNGLMERITERGRRRLRSRFKGGR